MTKFFALFCVALVAGCASHHSNDDQAADAAHKLTLEILTHGQAYSNLVELVSAGPRLSGSSGAAHAIEWAKAKMESYGLEHVTLQPFTAPAWERGSIERAAITSVRPVQPLKVVALGNSVGTARGGIEGEVVELQKLEDADKQGDRLKGKIVFFNRPMDPTLLDTFKAYGGAVDQRGGGASRAGKYGAIAVLVRAMTLREDGHPHTGMMRYEDGAKKIPAASITTEDADRLSSLLKNGPVSVKLDLSAKPLPSVESFNVYGQITGSEKPNDIVVVSGHLDSWDLSPGAHDNAAGCVQSLEVARAFKALGIRPKRTLRVVFYMSEEFGGIGADEYARQVKLKGEKHYAAIESDSGGFTPRGFTVAKPESLARIRSWGGYFEALGADYARATTEAGTDVEPLALLGVPTFGYLPDSQRYFDYHHSDYDDLKAVNPRELHMGAASMAILTYLLSERGL